MKNKIVLITEYFYPDQRNDSKLLFDIVKKLANINNGKINVICTSELKNNKEIDFLSNKIYRLKKNKLDKDKIFSRIIKFLLLTLKLSFKSFFVIKPNDRVLITTNPAFLMPVIALFKKFKKFELTILVYDVFPENLNAANIISSKSRFYKILRKIYNWSYSKADRLIVLGKDMEDVILDKTEKSVSTFQIENWCDYQSIIPHEKSENKILKDLNLINKKVFLFSGNFGRVQGIKNLLEASTLVKNNNFVLLFIGNGACKKEIEEHIKDSSKNNVFYAGEFPPSSQNEFLNACDISIISLNKDMYGLGVPSKSYYNMAAKKPLLYIGDKNSEISSVINKFNLGWVVEPGNSLELANKFDMICEKSDEYDDIGQRARNTVEQYYSKEVILKKYEKLYGEVQ